jgi:Na+/H+-dicarboxylate symporter
LIGFETSEKEKSKTMKILWWIVRISALMSAGFIAIIIISEGISDGFGSLLNLTTHEIFMITAYVFLWIGLLLGGNGNLWVGCCVLVV